MAIASYIQKLILIKSMYPEKGHLIVFNKFKFHYLLAESMAIISQKIAEDLGEDFLFDLGYKAGDDTADEMFEKMHLENNSVAKNLNIVITMCEVLGFGKFNVKKFDAKNGLALLNVFDNPVIDASAQLYGKKSMVSALYRGIYSVHAAREMKVKNCRFIETKSVCNGDKYNEWSSGIFKK